MSTEVNRERPATSRIQFAVTPRICKISLSFFRVRCVQDGDSGKETAHLYADGQKRNRFHHDNNKRILVPTNALVLRSLRC